ncbi:MAG: DUF935 family protein [Leptolyngbyaceae cyanobacterium]
MPALQLPNLLNITRQWGGVFRQGGDVELAAKPAFNEIANIGGGRDITRPYIDSLGNLLLPQDQLLLLKGGYGHEALKLYEKVEDDDRVFSGMTQRILAVTRCPWAVTPGKRRQGSETKADRKAADFLREQLDQIPFDSITEESLWGRFYGYNIGEPLYTHDARYVVWDPDRGGIRVRHRRRFKFDWDFQPRLLTLKQPLGELHPPNTFWHTRFGGNNSDDPYGKGLAHWLYWLVWFKRNDIKFWAFFLEKFGQPTAVGKYQAGTDKTEQDKLLSCLYSILTDAGIILPEGMNIELLEATRSGTADYAGFYAQMDAAITRVILGQTATTEGTAGKLGNEDGQQSVKEEIIEADSDLLCGSFNRHPVRWLIDHNRDVLGDCVYPQVWRQVKPDEDINARSEREVKIFATGRRLTDEKFEEIYGDGYERTDGAIVPAGSSPDVGAPTPDLTEGTPTPSPSQEGSLTPAQSGVEVQATALNGAQIKSLLELVQAVSQKELPLESAIKLIQISFPTVDETMARQLLQPAEGFTPASLEPTPNPSQEGTPDPPPTPPERGGSADLSDPLPDPEFASTPTTVEAFGAQLRTAVTPEIAALLQGLREALQAAETLEEFQEYIEQTAPDLLADPTLAELMAPAFEAARKAGIYEAQQEAGGDIND